jgi:hypothetical protein
MHLLKTTFIMGTEARTNHEQNTPEQGGKPCMYVPVSH